MTNFAAESTSYSYCPYCGDASNIGYDYNKCSGCGEYFDRESNLKIKKPIEGWRE